MEIKDRNQAVRMAASALETVLEAKAREGLGRPAVERRGAGEHSLERLVVSAGSTSCSFTRDRAGAWRLVSRSDYGNREAIHGVGCDASGLLLEGYASLEAAVEDLFLAGDAEEVRG